VALHELDSLAVFCDTPLLTDALTHSNVFGSEKAEVRKQPTKDCGILPPANHEPR
jgi:hypothetical protein